MKKIFLIFPVVLLLYGCQGPTGSTGSQGPAGPTLPTYQLTFENGIYPDSGYSGNDCHWVDGSNPTSTPTTGEIRVGGGATTAHVQLGLFRAGLFYKIPSNAMVTSAYLQLTTKSSSALASGTYIFGVHQMLDPCPSPLTCPWDDSATWLQVYPDFGNVGWQPSGSSSPITMGVDYSSSPLDAVTVTARQINGNQVVLAWNLPASVVQPWTNGSNTSYGLCLSAEPQTTSSPVTGYISFWDNTGNIQQKPLMVVNYTVP